MGSLHGKSNGYFVILSDHIFNTPLNIWKAAAHHSDDRQITFGPLQRVSLKRHVEFAAGLINC